MMNQGMGIALLLTVAACGAQEEGDHPLPPQSAQATVGVAQQPLSVALPVKVTNSASEPVPTVLTGTSTVSAAQSGAWTVGISGTPSVTAAQSGSWQTSIVGDVNLAPDSTVIAQQGGGPWDVTLTGASTVSLAPGATVALAPATTVAVSGIAGTTDVKVVAMPAIALAGTPLVTVASSATAPVVVASRDEPARQPFQRMVSVNFARQETFSGEVTIDVPAGKRLVVDFISAWGIIGTGEAALIQLRANQATIDTSATFMFPMTRFGAFTDLTMEQVGVTQQTRAYALSTVTLEVIRSIGVSVPPYLEASGSIEISISGYTIDL